MNLLVISQYYNPEQFRINDICKEWVNRGHHVTVVTGIPNYPEGKYYQNYGIFKKRKETIDGVEIIRLPIIPRGKNSIMLMLNYISFVISGFFFSKFTKRDFDQVFIYEVSPMTQALPGVWYAKRKKIKCSIYVMDLWPESIELATGIHNQKVLHLVGKMVDYIYKKCDNIITSSKSFIKEIEKRGHSKEKISFWPQYAEEFYKPVLQENCQDIQIKQDDFFHIIFAGNIGQAQGLDVLIDTAKILKEKNLKVKIFLVGNGRAKENLMKQVEKNDLEKYVHFIDKKPATEIPKYYAMCDMAFISLKKDRISEQILPAKLQSYFACGIPVLGCIDGEVKDVIEDSKAGFCVESGNSEKLAEMIEKVVRLNEKERNQLSQNALNYFKKNYEKEMLLNKIETIIFN